jgi:hypothetical protein
MSETKPHLYVNPKGYLVTRHSYSGGDTFNYCAKKYYLERVQGWSDKQDRVARHFGIALEAGIMFWHQRGQNTAEAVDEFLRLWSEHKDKPYIYSKVEKDWESLGKSGAELIQLYTLMYPTLPYTVVNPKSAFQVQTNFEVFPGTKLAGIEFTSYIDLEAQLKDGKTPLIIDIKTSGKDIPDLLVLDPQLRSYAWVKGFPNVAFLWFRKMGREISKGDWIKILQPYGGFEPGASVVVLKEDDFGFWVTPDAQIEADMNKLFVGQSKAVVAARQAYIEANGKLVVESAITKQRVQFKMAQVSEASREDIGRSIRRDIVNIAAATEKDFFPMQSGVRFPNEKCPNCAMRGICSDNAELRDALVMRKHADDFGFGDGEE